jgi:predicted MFS family arabinose efflux permease
VVARDAIPPYLVRCSQNIEQGAGVKRNRLWLAGLFIATLALGTDEFVIAGVLAAVAADLDVTLGMAGQLVTAFALAFALGAPVLAVLLARYRRRWVLCGGLVLFVAANVGCAVAPDFWSLLGLRVLAGLTAAVVSTTAFAIAAEAAPHGRQGSYLSVVTAGLTVALFTGVPVGAWVADAATWRSTFLLIGVVAAVATVLVLVFVPDLSGSPPTSLAERLAPLRRPAVLRLVVTILLCAIGGLMFYSYLDPITRQATGSAEHLPLLLLLVGLVGVPAVLGGGRLVDRVGVVGSRLTVIGGHALTLVGLAVLVATGASLWLFALAVAAWSFFAWALNPPMQAGIIAAAPDAPMTAVSLNLSGLYLGTAGAGALGGLVLDLGDPTAIPIIAAATLLCAWIVATGHHDPARTATAAGQAGRRSTPARNGIRVRGPPQRHDASRPARRTARAPE